MNKSIQILIITAVVALGAIGLAVAPLQGGAHPMPATSTPSTGGARAPTPIPTATALPTSDAPPPIETVDVAAVLATADALGQLIPSATPTELPAVLTAWAEQGTVLPTETPVPPTPTQTPTPTMTGEEQAFVEERQHVSAQSASFLEECPEILKTKPWCSVPTYAKYIARPEWEALFPEARFLLERYDLYGGEFVQPKSILFIEQGESATARMISRD